MIREGRNGANEVSESEFQRALEIALNAPLRRTRLQRINSGVALIDNGNGTKRAFRGARMGTADFVGFWTAWGGKWTHKTSVALYIEIEAKKWNGKQSPKQRAREAAILRMGGLYIKVFADRFDLEKGVASALIDIDSAIAARERSL